MNGNGKEKERDEEEREKIKGKEGRERNEGKPLYGAYLSRDSLSLFLHISILKEIIGNNTTHYSIFPCKGMERRDNTKEQADVSAQKW